MASKTLRGLKILVAEDEGLIALELENVLLSFGCDVIGPVSRVDQLLNVAKRENIDGALLDVNLRGEQVFAVLANLKTMNFPIIITSGYEDASLFPEEFRDIPRIAKPFDADTLRRLCEKVFLS